MPGLRSALLLVVPMVASPAHAATRVVTTTADADTGACTASSCSLRDAVATAASGDVVRLPADEAHYDVSLGEIPVPVAITIRGAGARASIVDAKSRSRIFRVMSSVGNGTVTFERLTLTRGRATELGGGAVLGEFRSGNKVFRRVTLSRNTATAEGVPDGHFGGGAIHDDGYNLTFRTSTLSRNALTAANGGGGFNGGGAIWHCPAGPARLHVIGSTLRANRSVTNGNTGSANGGGAIYNVCSKLVVERSVLVGNSAVASENGQEHGAGNNGGGAIFNDSSNGVTVVRSTIARNTTTARDNSGGANGGGGILIQIGTLLVDSSTVGGNTANVSDAGRGDGGGGILNAASSGMAIRSSTISANTANLAGTTGDYSGGGGVWDGGLEPSEYVNVTIAGNITNVAEGTGNGGGGLNVTGRASLTNVTLAANVSRHAGGGGLYVGTGAGVVTIKSSILSANTSPTGTCDTDGSGHTETRGYNLEDGGFCIATSPADHGVGDARLGPLRDNGGPTRTMALLPGSPAIDVIPRLACTDQSEPARRVTADQRGKRRDGPCDAGAYERT
jgi:CSLREA domain-containing protein